MKHFVKTAAFSLFPGLVLFMMTEAGLRIFNFQYSNTPVEMRASVLRREGAAQLFTESENAGGVIRFVKDPRQLWVPAEPFARGAAAVKRPDVTRIAALGCSCTAGCVAAEKDKVARRAHGWTTLLNYPSMLENFLEQAQPGKFEVLNAGVGGHSSFQGLQRLKATVLPYRPDILLIYYGWNDHWLAPQEDKNAKVLSAWAVRLVNFLEKFRTVHFLHFVMDKLSRKTLESRAQLPVKLRVLPEDYRSNLNEMVRLARQNNIRVFLLTAPSDFTKWINPNPTTFPFDRNAVTDIHATYNQIVREVAGANQVTLIDLVPAVEEAERNGQEIISRDGIHLTGEGCRWLAAHLAKVLLG